MVLLGLGNVNAVLVYPYQGFVRFRCLAGGGIGGCKLGDHRATAATDEYPLIMMIPRYVSPEFIPLGRAAQPASPELAPIVLRRLRKVKSRM